MENNKKEYIEKDIKEDYKKIINTVPQMIWKLDINLKTVYTNSAWKKYTGGNLGVLDSKIAHPDDFSSTISAWKPNTTSNFFEVRRRIKNKDGIFHWFLTRGLWLNNFCYGTCTDINGLAEFKKEQLMSENTKTTLTKYTELLAQEEKDIAELVRLSLIEDAKTLAINVLEKEKTSDNIRINLEQVAIENDKEKTSDNIRINLEQVAIENDKEKTSDNIRINLEQVAIENDKEKTSDNIRINLEQVAIENDKEKLKAEQIRIELEETAIEKENARKILSKDAKMLKKMALEKEKEKLIAENTRICLAETAIQKEKEKIIAEKKRVQLEEIAIEKEKEKLIADKKRIELEETAELLAGEVIRKEKERITNEKHRSELEKHNLELIRAKYAEEELLSFISHEIRNSLYQTISMNSFLQDTSLTTEQEEYLTILKNSSDFMLRLVNNLLDKKELDYNNNIELRPVDLNVFFQNVIKTNEKQIHEKNILFNMEIPKFEFKIFTNYDKFLQIFTNIIGNAIKFTNKGSISLIVKILNENETELELEISISDTGIGIPSDKIDTLFKPFIQSSEDIKKKYGGSGLGLSICKKLVTLMNGSIVLTSVLNEGSTFTIKMPFKKVNL